MLGKGATTRDVVVTGGARGGVRREVRPLDSDRRGIRADGYGDLRRHQGEARTDRAE